MSTTWIKVSKDLLLEDQTQSTATLNANGSVESVTKQVIETWYAQTDGTSRGTSTEATTATDGTLTVPQVGNLYAFPGTTGTVFTCTRTFPQRTGANSFKIQCEYNWKYTPTTAGKFNTDIKFSGQSTTQPCYYDKDNKPVTNSAGNQFDQPVPQTISDELISVTYSTTSDQSAALAAARETVCNGSVSFTIKGISRTYPHRGLKCLAAEQSVAVTDGSGANVYRVTANFLARIDTFQTKILDQGYMQLNGSGTGVVVINDTNGDKVTTPQNLDGAGHYQVPTATPVYITFLIEPETDFTSLFTGLS
jgi:hypothetical protein